MSLVTRGLGGQRGGIVTGGMGRFENQSPPQQNVPEFIFGGHGGGGGWINYSKKEDYKSPQLRRKENDSVEFDEMETLLCLLAIAETDQSNFY